MLRLLTAAVLAVAATSVAAAPFGYSVNSDGDVEGQTDRLHLIDLATGEATAIGPVGFFDVEGLGFDGDGVLFGADDATETLIVVDTETGAGSAVGGQQRNLGLATGSENFDFGLTFDCSGALWLSSDVTETVYRVDTDSGVAEPSFTGGGLPITALAAYGDALYGITSGAEAALYRIFPDNNEAVLIGELDLPYEFQDAGMDFDEQGRLWAIGEFTPARFAPSEIFTIDLSTGRGTPVVQTLVGFESLAIAPTQACGGGVPAPEIVPALDVRSLALLALALLGIAAVRLRG